MADKHTQKDIHTVGQLLERARLRHGYLNNPAANAAAFIEGWFRAAQIQGSYD